MQAAADICFIGAGNMTGALVAGLIGRGQPAGTIRVGSPGEARRQALAGRHGVVTGADNTRMADGAGVLVLSVKPALVSTVARELAPLVQAQRPLVISVAAGVRCRDLLRWLACDAALVRAMPNTPSAIGLGASALYASPAVDAGRRQTASDILGAVGLVEWVRDESLIDVVTGISGSGPAYVFLLLEALIAAGVDAGLSDAGARRLAARTVLGAAGMVEQGDAAPADLRAAVTSPGGTTEQAIRTLQSGGFAALVGDAVAAARQRAAELGERFGAE